MLCFCGASAHVVVFVVAFALISRPSGQVAGDQEGFIVWAKQLQMVVEVFKPIGNTFKVKSLLKDIDDLKKSIKKEKPSQVICDADQIDIYRLEGGKWKKEDEGAEVRRDTTSKDFYGFALPE